MRHALRHILAVAVTLTLASWVFESSVTAGRQGAAVTPEAISAFAKSVGVVDVVGVKLGMTLEQAVAALKASNPKLVIDVHDVQMTAGARTSRRPRVILAHLPAGGRNPEVWGNPDGSHEALGVQLTPPPGPAVVELVVRYVSFPSNAPIGAGTLIDAMRKKYGAEGWDDRAQYVGWLFDTAGKPVTGALVQQCANAMMGPPMLQLSGADIRGGSSASAPGMVFGSVNELTINLPNFDRLAAKCFPYVVVRSDIYHANPSMPVNDFWVSLQSTGLMRNGIALADAFIKGEVAGQTKQQEQDASKRAVPKL